MKKQIYTYVMLLLLYIMIDHDKDGYLIMQEFGHLIQMHTDQALRRGQKHLHEDMHKDFIHPSWRDDL
jgi:hypothetical protein